MYSQRPPPLPLPLKRSYSGESHSSRGSAATTVSRSSSKLLFGEIPLTPATTVDGRSIRSNGSICNLVLSNSSVFLRFWLNDQCRDNLLEHLGPQDLSSFRLVCHDFSSKAAPRLFEALGVTFKPSSFSKPARMEALSRIGRHVKTFTFRMPHGPDTFLPPLIDPFTGTERQFLYEPQIQTPQPGPSATKVPKYGSWELQDLLVKQYPPLFHAATNVPAFVAAFSHLTNLTHLTISCPGSRHAPRHRRSAVDYALISLRIAVERAPLSALCSLSLQPMHPGGLLYLHPMHGFGSTPSSAKRWAQIRSLSMTMDCIPLSDAVPLSPRSRAHSLEHLRILHAYLRTLSRRLTRLSFRWLGARGPSPLSLDTDTATERETETCMLTPSPPHHLPDKPTHPHSPTKPAHPPRPLLFPALHTLTLSNSTSTAPQIAAFISAHARTLVDFNFEAVTLKVGDWDDALRPLTRLTGGEAWMECMDVPVVLREGGRGTAAAVAGGGGGGGAAAAAGQDSAGLRVGGRLDGEVLVGVDGGREARERALSYTKYHDFTTTI
ncbi:hypothetical protein IAQ61_000860 [Plenodomus lingam]|uniref:uncharacterized protein n=1 Tax=Leptosphaeria maculans TaxID=5022 RepID=UPI00332DDF2A|nr:hypothetical protein IAQ61_000860 [Plenodomus lingam]